jgi:hypothetical protein
LFTLFSNIRSILSHIATFSPQRVPLLKVRAMRRIVPLLAATLFASLLTVLLPLRAEAGASLPLLKPAAAAASQTGLLQLAGYYGGYHTKQYGDDYDDGGYDHHQQHHYCGTRYESKYVCEQTEPRCFKQRECIWHYGHEYCRYVHKCVGGERYCKWVKYPVEDCGCDYCGGH